MLYAINSVVSPNPDDSPNTATFLLATGGLATAAGLSIMINAKIKKNRVISEYNGVIRRNKKQVGLYLRPGVNRIAIALKF